VCLVVAASLAGCGDDDEATKAEPESKPITFEQLSHVPLGARRARVERVLGPPYRRQETKPSGVAYRCYRYRGIAENGEVDSANEYRLCYNRRGRLSVKSTAPVQ
jgi:hypothetical protein